MFVKPTIILLLSILCSSTFFGQQLLEESFVGPITGDTILYNIHLPAGYDTATTDYPVIYHLHGLGGNQGGPQNVSVPAILDQAFQLGVIDHQYIIVFPNGLGGSMWADSKSGHVKPETHLVQELIPHIDSMYLTIANRQHRYIQGFSMGGFGAAKFLGKYPELFKSAVAFDAAMHNWSSLVANRPDIALDIFDNDQSYFEQYAPWYFFRENSATLTDSVCLKLSVGDLVDYNQAFHDSLTYWGIPHDYLLNPCGHNLNCILNNDGSSSATFLEKCLEEKSNIWIGGMPNNNWLNANNWSLGTIPTSDDHVIIPSGTFCFIPPMSNAICLSIDVKLGAILISPSDLEIVAD